MAWKYRSPFSFPARYPEALREAVAKLEVPILLHSGTLQSAYDEAEQFRYCRWCLRKKPEVLYSLANLDLTYNIRTSVQALDRGRGLLYLSAKPTALSDLSSLNPHLDRIIADACQ